MRVNGNLCQNSNKFLNVASINRGLAKNEQVSNSGEKSKEKKDVFTVSPQGKIINMLNNLNKQKERIEAKKNELMAKAADGGDIDAIKSQLQVYGEQLQDIEKQISDIYAQQAKEAAEKAKETDEKKNTETDKTEQETQIEEISDIAAAGDIVKDSNKIYNIKERTKQQGKIKEAEAKMDKLRVDNLESSKILSSNPNSVELLLETARLTVKDKEAEAKEIFEKADDINSKAASALKQANKKLDEQEQDENSDILTK